MLPARLRNYGLLSGFKALAHFGKNFLHGDLFHADIIFAGGLPVVEGVDARAARDSFPQRGVSIRARAE